MNALRKAARSVLNSMPGTQDWCDAMEALDKAVSESKRMGWRPIETAPKGKSVLLFCAGAYVPIYCGRKRYGFPSEPQFNELVWRCDSSGRFAHPTHWAPIPAAPKVKP